MKINFGLKTEDELLLYLAQTSLNSETKRKISLLIDGKIEWNYLIDKASKNGLKPLLYLNLKNFSNKIPKSILNSFKEFYLMNSQKNLMFFAEMLRLLKIFEENMITLIPYKGPLMAFLAYGDLSLREFSDLDMLIHKEDFPAVKKILLNDDYKPLLNLDYSKEVEYLKSQREYKFKNIKNGLILEIQWNTVGSSFTFPNEFSYPLDQENFKLISIYNRNIKIFSSEDLILILSLHVAEHLWERLSWICDIVEFIKRTENINWDQIIKKADFLGIERILYLNLALSQTIFNLELPDKVQIKIKNDTEIKDLEKRILKIIFAPETFKFMDKVILRFKIREYCINGFKDILKILIIPHSDEWVAFEKNYPISLLYILIRPKQIIKRIKE